MSTKRHAKLKLRIKVSTDITDFRHIIMDIIGSPIKNMHRQWNGTWLERNVSTSSHL